jgi:PBP1b-binding outer membrane lipoprotein LpoB
LSYALALAVLLAGCGPSQADLDAAAQRQAEARADSLEVVSAQPPTVTGPAPTALDSIGIAELERNDHLKRMADSVQSSLGL